MNDGFHGLYQFRTRIPFDNVSRRTRIEGCPDNLDIGLLAQEKDFRVRSKLANLSSGGDAIHCRKVDIKNDQIVLQLFGFPNRLQSICGFHDDLKFSPFP